MKYDTPECRALDAKLLSRYLQRLQRDRFTRPDQLEAGAIRRNYERAHMWPERHMPGLHIAPKGREAVYFPVDPADALRRPACVHPRDVAASGDEAGIKPTGRAKSLLNLGWANRKKN